MKRITSVILGLLLAVSAVFLYASASNEAGNAHMVRGTVTAAIEGQEPRTLTKDSPIFETDTIKTGSKSFAVIKLKDGTRITIRPDSELSIKKFTFNDQEEEAELQLVRGGMRAITGLMGKSNPDAMKVKTAYATMGIRGTSYDIRVCDADCVQEENQKSGVVVLKSQVVGRAVNVDGGLKAVSLEGKSRQLAEGGPIYPGDQLLTDAQGKALLVFRDNTRLALQPSSKLILKDYAYDENTKAGGRFDAKLLKGNVQVKPGLIGQNSPDMFNVHTAKTRIGAEGTKFTANDDDIDLKELFAVDDHDFAKPGAYVTVYDGHINVRRPASNVAGHAMVASLELLSGFELLAQANPNEKVPEYIDLGRGEAAFVDTESLYRIIPPLFMTEDCYPHPDDYSEDSVWPPIFFKGDSCASVYAVFTAYGAPSIEGGPLSEPGFDQPIPPRVEPPVPEKPGPETPGPETPGPETPGPETPDPPVSGLI